MKKTIAFFCCSNGYGHFKRVTEVAKHLVDDFTIDIFCERYQYDKIKSLVPANYIFYNMPNIRWDKTLLEKDSSLSFTRYESWIEHYKKEIDSYDYVVSDNIVGLLQYRHDIILMGSFLWKDVFQQKFKDNKLSNFDNALIEKYNPPILTNRYAEIGSLSHYTNKRQFGFGCSVKPKIRYWENALNIVIVEPSLHYLEGYKKCMDTIKQYYGGIDSVFTVHTTPTITEDCIYVIRPGVGMITHCVEHSIPMFALYSPDDSEEIKHLADKIQQLEIGMSQNIDNLAEVESSFFHDYKMKKLQSNRIYNKVALEREGYVGISSYLKKIML